MPYHLTDFVRVQDIITSTVTEVKVDDKLVGSIVKQYPLAAGSGTIDNAIATINGNEYVLGEPLVA